MIYNSHQGMLSSNNYHKGKEWKNHNLYNVLLYQNIYYMAKNMLILLDKSIFLYLDRRQVMIHNYHQDMLNNIDFQIKMEQRQHSLCILLLFLSKYDKEKSMLRISNNKRNNLYLVKYSEMMHSFHQDILNDNYFHTKTE